MYNFRTWLRRNYLEFDTNNFVPPKGAMGEDDMAKIKELLGKDYENFVKQLGDFIKDPKFLLALQAATEHGQKAQLVNKVIPVMQLKPTQNEVALHNSLEFPLKHAEKAEKYLKGGNVLVKGPIITGGGGTFIIDGHHRWSQLYVVNPGASIQAIDIANIEDPEQALKAVQIGIAAAKGSIPTSSAQGSANLLNIDQQTLTNYVMQNIKPDVVAVFQKYMGGNNPQTQQPKPPMPMQQQPAATPNESFYSFYQKMLREAGEQQMQTPATPVAQPTQQQAVQQQPMQQPMQQQQNDEAGKQQVASFIWKNVSQMMQNNQPLAPAAKRDIMPQTGEAPGWEKKTASQLDTTKEHRRRARGKLFSEWQALAGVKPPPR